MKVLKIKIEDLTKNEAKNFKTRSITLTQDQIDFCNQKSLNLSKLVREILDGLIKQDLKK